jgi:hypothetical protein
MPDTPLSPEEREAYVQRKLAEIRALIKEMQDEADAADAETPTPEGDTDAI